MISPLIGSDGEDQYWVRMIDTALDLPEDSRELSQAPAIGDSHHATTARAAVVFASKSAQAG